MRKYQRRLDAIRREADKAIGQLVKELRAAYVVPYCDRYGVRFRSGMGTWAFFDDCAFMLRDTDGRGDGEGRKLPRRLCDVLNLETPVDCVSLGALMDDYTPKD